MLPFATSQAVVAIACPAVVYAVIITSDTFLLPIGKRRVVGEVVNVGASAHSPEHLINLGLCGSTSAYRVLRVLLDATGHC
jgi:hypothetical protein